MRCAGSSLKKMSFEKKSWIPKNNACYYHERRMKYYLHLGVGPKFRTLITDDHVAFTRFVKSIFTKDVYRRVKSPTSQ